MDNTDVIQFIVNYSGVIRREYNTWKALIDDFGDGVQTSVLLARVEDFPALWLLDQGAPQDERLGRLGFFGSNLKQQAAIRLFKTMKHWGHQINA